MASSTVNDPSLVCVDSTVCLDPGLLCWYVSIGSIDVRSIESP